MLKKAFITWLIFEAASAIVGAAFYTKFASYAHAQEREREVTHYTTRAVGLGHMIHIEFGCSSWNLSACVQAAEIEARDIRERARHAVPDPNGNDAVKK